MVIDRNKILDALLQRAIVLTGTTHGKQIMSNLHGTCPITGLRINVEDCGLTTRYLAFPHSRKSKKIYSPGNYF